MQYIYFTENMYIDLKGEKKYYLFDFQLVAHSWSFKEIAGRGSSHIETQQIIQLCVV